MKRPLVIRADAGTQIGTGHVMRCLALAQAWQDAGGAAAFVTGGAAPALHARLRAEGYEIVRQTAAPGSREDAAETLRAAGILGASWIVVDGYHFGADYQQWVKEAGALLLFLDDNGHAEHYFADLVLNPNLHAHEGLYARRGAGTQLLLGPRYALLRREFWPWRGWMRETAQKPSKILVTLGGSDPDNVTGRVLSALQQLKTAPLDATVVIGASNPHQEALRRAAASSPRPFHLVSSVTDMPQRMAWADVAVSAGGGTCAELAMMGLPALAIILADNQRRPAAAWERAGVLVNLGWHAGLSEADIAQAVSRVLDSTEMRADMARSGQSLVDGNGCERVIECLGLP